MNHINEKAGHGGLPYLELCHKGAVAHVYLHGAHVLHYQPDGEKPVLWHSQKSAFEDGKPIRGGVPVCWPWFGAHPSDGSMAFHGPVRLSAWTLEDSAITDKAASITLHCLTAEEFGISLSMTVELGSALTLTLNAKNTGNSIFPLTEALHSYFSVSDISNISVSGLEDVYYIDKVPEGFPVVKQAGEVTFSAETNRIYFDTLGECIIHDSAWNRRIRISKNGSRSTVVWNPWAERAATMPDFGDNEYPEMVCVETANCGPNSIELAPGEEHAIQTQIEVMA
jgi:D-hexose-6-phosphate mutarotase